MSVTHLHGVNLTGWLTLEPWVTPELFAAAGALDEESLVTTLGPERYAEVVRRHRASFVTREDFLKIAARGFNSVRLPVPWYVYGEEGPNPGPYQGCIELVDEALEWAEEFGLKVVFVLAVNPGAPRPASAGSDDVPAHDLSDGRLPRDRVLDVVYALSRRYATRMGFFGMELADDVVVRVRQGLSLSDGVATHRLRNYYREAYEMVREAAGYDVVVILPDGGVPRDLRRFMAQRHYRNVWVDCHLDRADTRVDVSGPSGVRRLVESCERHIAEARRTGMPAMVGKWSASLPIADSSMTPEGRIALERVYTSEQIAAYEKCPAWFFNTWKTSGMLAGWDARVALATFERGMIA